MIDYIKNWGLRQPGNVDSLSPVSEHLAGELTRAGDEYRIMYTSFAAAVREFQQQGYSLATVADMAAALQDNLGFWFEHTPVNTVLCNHAFIQTGREELLLVSGKRNPLLSAASKAVQAHQRGNGFYLSRRQMRSLEQLASSDPGTALQTGVFRIDDATCLRPRYGLPAEIPAPGLAREPLLQYLFGGKEQAQQYGQYLQERKRSGFQVDYFRPTDKQLKTFSEQRCSATGLEWSGLDVIRVAPVADMFHPEERKMCIGIRK